METFFIALEMLRRLLSRLGPYALLEIALPGGTLLALLLYLYRRRNSSVGRSLPSFNTSEPVSQFVQDGLRASVYVRIA